MATTIQGMQSTPALTVCPCPTLTSHLQTYQLLHTQNNKTGNMFSLLLDTHTCDIAIINANTMLIVCSHGNNKQPGLSTYTSTTSLPLFVHHSIHYPLRPFLTIKFS